MDTQEELTTLTQEEKLRESVRISRELLKRKWLSSLWFFNRQCLKVEQGEHRSDLGLFHREMCDFVDNDRNKQKLILVPRGHLKALKTDGTLILTQSGFVKYKDLKVGDKIIGGDGNQTKVIKIHPRSKMALYRVTTNDGREIICNNEHLFLVRVQVNDKKWKIRSLNWIKKRYSKERLDKRDGKMYTEHPVQLKPIKIYFNKRNVPIEPYTLGMWLGDGISSGSAMTSADPEIFSYSEYVWHKNNVKYLYNTHGLQKILRLNNLKNNKHIPNDYLISSYSQRLELLRGLMDTGGTCHCQGGIGYFSNTNYRLIKNFVELVRSLGGVAMICKVNQEVNGELYNTWTVSVRLPDNINPFKLKRKANQYNGLKRELTINIVHIEKVEDDSANCITVERNDGMFIANDYFPTHNSSLVTIGKTLQWIAQNPRVRILIANATYSMAVAFLTVIKRHLQNNTMFKLMFGDLASGAEKWSENSITFNQEGIEGGEKEANVFCYGMGGNLVSQHYDKIILDDVVNEDTVATREQIEKTIQFYRMCQPLLEKNGEMIIIGTRWRDDDLYSWILDKENGVLPDFNIFARRALSNELWDQGKGKFVKGEVLWDTQYTLDYFSGERRKMGPYTFSAQYMNECIPNKEADFKREWFSYYETSDIRGVEMNRYTLIDPAISLDKDADFTAMVTVGIDANSTIYILDILREHFTPDEMIKAIFQQNERWHPNAIALEQVAFQTVLRYSLKKEMDERKRYLNMIELKPRARTKDSRIRGLQPLYANGKVLHNRDLLYTIYLEDELLRFPLGKHDDILDALAYALDVIHPANKKVTKNRSHTKYLYG